MPKGLKSYARWRLINTQAQKVVVSELAHLNQSSITRAMPQPASAGQAMLGTFSIPLHPPGSEKFKANADQYALADYGLRAEAYRSPNGRAMGGDPFFAGYVTKIEKDFDQFVISGEDALYRLQSGPTAPMETISGLSDVVATQMLSPFNVVYGDDFSNGIATPIVGSTTWNNADAWASGIAEGVSAANHGAPGASDGQMWLNATPNDSDFLIEATFGLVCASSAGNLCEGGVTLALSDMNNLFLFRAIVNCISASHFEVDAEIYTRSGGAFTLRSQRKAIITTTSNTWRGQVSVHGVVSGGNTTYFLTVGGKEAGSYGPIATPAAGHIGLRASNSSGASTTYCPKFVYSVRQPAFVQGSVWTAGSYSINQVADRQPQLDLLVACATQEGFDFRLTPKAWPALDVVEFGAVGTDLSTTVILQEGKNIESAQFQVQNEPFGTALDFSGSPSNDSIGIIRDYNLKQIAARGTWFTTASLPELGDPSASLRTARQLTTMRATPGVAKTFSILNDATVTDRYRDGDTILFKSGRLNIAQKVRCYAITVTDGVGTREVVLDQRKWSFRNELGRLRSSVNHLVSGRRGTTATLVSGGTLAGISNDSRVEQISFVVFSPTNGAFNAATPITIAFDLSSYFGNIRAILSWSSANAVNHIIIDGTDRIGVLGANSPVDISSYFNHAAPGTGAAHTVQLQTAVVGAQPSYAQITFIGELRTGK